MSKASKKSLPLAVGLNLVLPGLGYMYMGRAVLGILALIIIGAILLAAGPLAFAQTWLTMNVIMGIDMAILAGKNKEAVAAATLKKCPHCAELIQRQAKLCRYCRSDLTA